MGIDKISADILTRTTQLLRSGSEDDLKRLRKYLTNFKVLKDETSATDKEACQDFAPIVDELKHAKSSNEAMELLDRYGLTKDYLVKLSKEIGLPVVKSDRFEHLKLRIIHELVESRLNSDAIQNPNSSYHQQ